MDDYSKRMASLSPEQRELLELRLKKKGLRVPFSQDSSQAPVNVARSNISPDNAEDFDAWKNRSVGNGVKFSLYFFSDDGSKGSADKYRLVIESAKFADTRGFSAIWTPERHFQDFGGLYPNPSVLSAALAMITERIGIRAGSVALPLHNPIRVAEEWSVVDNLSKGRVGISFASGWHADDFVFFPENYEDRKEIMFHGIETIQRLWAGETVKFQGGGGREVELKILPRPVQPRLPVWITSAGSPQTWDKAGEIGAGVLTTLVGYSFEDLSKQINLYRERLARHGHDASARQVTLMLHTFIGDDNASVKGQVKEPLCHYLRSYVKQFKNLNPDVGSLTQEDMDTLVAVAFENYFETGALLGTPNKCAPLIERLIGIGVDEVACLIDFGVETDRVLESLHRLNELREHYQKIDVQDDGLKQQSASKVY
ncbi:MAG TPA: LLM class flavin-dependent oxidoreductase [Pyrinomonadaceae bacterium]|jgi:natural product biosynthesis luciferase-like monooxygenase protein